jgi:hypothetical protein
MRIVKELPRRRFAATAPLEHKWTDHTIGSGDFPSAAPFRALRSPPQRFAPQGLATIFKKIEAIPAFL